MASNYNDLAYRKKMRDILDKSLHEEELTSRIENIMIANAILREVEIPQQTLDLIKSISSLSWECFNLFLTNINFVAYPANILPITVNDYSLNYFFNPMTIEALEVQTFMLLFLRIAKDPFMVKEEIQDLIQSLISLTIQEIKVFYEDCYILFIPNLFGFIENEENFDI